MLHPKLRESWAPGSAKLHEKGAFLFHFHRPDMPLASTASGRLRFEERSDGLHYEAELPNTSLGEDMLALIHLEEIRGVSPGFAFQPGGTKWTYGPDFATRNITNAKVGEISLTHIPSYASTTVELRNQGGLDEDLKQLAERERYLARLRETEMKRKHYSFTTQGN